MHVYNISKRKIGLIFLVILLIIVYFCLQYFEAKMASTETVEFNNLTENFEFVLGGEDMIEFYSYDGGVIKQEWHSTARQRGWNEERKRTTTEKRLKTLEARKNAKEC